MTEILFIRHGETAWNAERRLQGHLDVPLNAEGRRQAAALARALRDEHLDAVIASDLSRAKETAQAVLAERNLPLRIEPDLRERCYGAFEGLLHNEISERYPDAYLAWKSRDIDARFPSGINKAETMREFSGRVVAAVRRLVGEGAYRRVALVTHGGVLECVYRFAQGVGFGHARDFEIRNASVNRFVWDDGSLRLLQWGDVSHLSLALDDIDS